LAGFAHSLWKSSLWCRCAIHVFLCPAGELKSQSTKLQRERCLRIMEDMHHLLCALTSLAIHSDHIQDPKMLEQIAHYSGWVLGSSKFVTDNWFLYMVAAHFKNLIHVWDPNRSLEQSSVFSSKAKSVLNWILVRWNWGPCWAVLPSVFNPN
jgi:hypothetical protein